MKREGKDAKVKGKGGGRKKRKAFLLYLVGSMVWGAGRGTS